MVDLLNIAEPKTVLNDLTAYLKSANVSSRNLAHRVGISSSDMIRYLNGRSEPRAGRYIAILQQADLLIREEIGDERGIKAIL